ncbi:hypothetical protein WME98_53025 [Sorangium sp. So ce296]|uniref:hypothetical protein n=1 Tax=Sorangium sp. So ce296 TaxID=3133296 RepID=UPI003F63618E
MRRTYRILLALQVSALGAGCGDGTVHRVRGRPRVRRGRGPPRSAVAEDPFGPAPETWRSDVAILKGDLSLMRGRMEALLGGAARGD